MLIAAVIYFIVQAIYFNPTISEVRGYYFTYPALDYKIGDIVLICVWDSNRLETMHKLKLPYVDNACPYRTPHLMKRIVGVAGDIVTINVNGIYINGNLLPNSQAQTEFKHIQLKPLGYSNFKLKANEYFVLGMTIHSYDSRYFGVIDKAQLHRRAVLIWPKDKPLLGDLI